MRQLITRIDEALHDLLRARAASEGRSVNALVTEVLTAAVTKQDERAALRARLRAAGLLVKPPQPKRRPPSLDAVIASTRGSGTAVSEALEADRDGR
ncbi:MAG: toxin-antitoxin system HicB family antitoxin [Actinomycetota bacterium]